MVSRSTARRISEPRLGGGIVLRFEPGGVQKDVLSQLFERRWALHVVRSVAENHDPHAAHRIDPQRGACPASVPIGNRVTARLLLSRVFSRTECHPSEGAVTG